MIKEALINHYHFICYQHDILVNKNYYNKQRDYKYYSIHDYSHTAFIQYYRNLLLVSHLSCLISKYALKCYCWWLQAVNLKSDKIIDDLGTTSFRSTLFLRLLGSRMMFWRLSRFVIHVLPFHPHNLHIILFDPSTLAISGSSLQFLHWTATSNRWLTERIEMSAPD